MFYIGVGIMLQRFFEDNSLSRQILMEQLDMKLALALSYISTLYVPLEFVLESE